MKDYAALAKAACNATADASQTLLREMLRHYEEGDPIVGTAFSPEREAFLDKRRGELWLEALTGAGIELRWIDDEDECECSPTSWLHGGTDPS